tara:strand:- start:332 stop:436 length:105 start_codon:yes stop_codon:yes gene_type:complete
MAPWLSFSNLGFSFLPGGVFNDLKLEERKECLLE